MAEALIDPDKIWLGVSTKSDNRHEDATDLFVDRRRGGGGGKLLWKRK